MPVFTVHGPRAGTAPSPDRIAFVRDGFSSAAFVFGGFWLAYHRLWLALSGYLVAIVALSVAMTWLGVPSGARLGVMFFIALLMGFEAASLRRWTLSRRKWRQLDLVVAQDREIAERRFFERWNLSPRDDDKTQRAACAPAYSSAPRDEIVGLFPQPGMPR